MKEFYLKPKFFETIKNYSKDQLVKDIIAGIIVAIIALPLSIALALASGVEPACGVYTAIFAGFVGGENLRQLYSHARMFVLSSENEGFPLVMLEAMNYELPMVVSDIPATHLIELPNECYAKKCDVESLASRINHIYHSQQTPEYDLTEYNWERIAKHTIDEY